MLLSSFTSSIRHSCTASFVCLFVCFCWFFLHDISFFFADSGLGFAFGWRYWQHGFEADNKNALGQPTLSKQVQVMGGRCTGWPERCWIGYRGISGPMEVLVLVIRWSVGRSGQRNKTQRYVREDYIFNPKLQKKNDQLTLTGVSTWSCVFIQ